MNSAVPSPLKGKRIVITRAADQSDQLCRELAAHGAAPLLLPLIQIVPPEDFAPLDAALRNLSQFDWLFLTSQNVLRALADRCQALGTSLPAAAGSMRVAAVGPSTAEAAKHAGLRVTYMARIHQGVALADELGAQLASQNIFLTRSERASRDLPERLVSLGARVTEVVAYRNSGPSAADAIVLAQVARGSVDAVLFFSPSAVQHFAELLGADCLRNLQSSVAFAAIGPVTAAALREAAIEQFVIAPEATVSAILEALAGHWAEAAHAGAKPGARR